MTAADQASNLIDRVAEVFENGEDRAEQYKEARRIILAYHAKHPQRGWQTGQAAAYVFERLKWEREWQRQKA